MSTKKQNNALHLTAIHEAAHAVACLVLKRKFKYITVVPKDGGLGHILYSSNNTSLIENISGLRYTMSLALVDRKVRQHNIITLAGYVAELKLGINNTVGASSDFDRVVEFSLNHAGDGDSAQALVNECLNQTKQLVDENWCQIKGIAEALLQNGKMQYGTVFALSKRIEENNLTIPVK